MTIKIFSTEYVDGNILYYDFQGTLFSIEVSILSARAPVNTGHSLVN
jgi:hypothetical protein